MELRAYLSYRRRPESLCYWRSTAQHEADFVVGDHTAINVKAAGHVTPRDLRGLQAIAEEHKFRHLLCVSEDRTPATHGQIRCVPVADIRRGALVRPTAPLSRRPAMAHTAAIRPPALR